MIHALALTGPTASGKTALSLEIAKILGCEIISLDSMQIYKGMDIGTAKATKEEQESIPHHMIDILFPDTPFSTKAYRDIAIKIANDISSRGKIPLFVGGTGLYLSTILRPDCEEAPESDSEYRAKIEATLKTEEDKMLLWERLLKADPESASSVHYNNTRRVIRALEIYDKTGKTKTYFDSLTKAKNKDIEITHISLDFHSRELLYERIDERVDIMLNAGLIEEVEKLLSKGYLSCDTTAGQAIGYKEVVNALKSGIDPKEATETIKQASRNYAKRQLTWFRHTEDVNLVYADDENGKIKSQDSIIKECLLIFKKQLRRRK